MARNTHRLTIACIVSSAIAIAGAASAGEWKPGGSVDDQVKMMDSNGDGTISAEEHAAGADKMFKMLDANKDGNVTTQEMDAARAAAGHPAQAGEMSSADKIKVIDSNGDGVLSASEHSTGSMSMFTKTDANGDGNLSVGEIKAAHAAMMGKKEGH